MFKPKALPVVNVTPETVVFGGGLDLISPPGMAKPGTARFSLNYEQEFGGGYRRLGGFERFDGRPSPHQAEYVLLEASAGWTAAVGNTVVGFTSGATGKVVYKSTDNLQIAVTKITGGPFVLEQLRVSGTPVGTVTEDQPTIDGFYDNILAETAANDYRTDIARPTGTGPILGVAVLNDIVYCWRENAGALATYKNTASGWTLVPLFSTVSFTAGSTAYTDGSSLTQGGASATVRRVVLESGTWAGGTAAGRLIIEPISGSFSAGVAGGGGIATLAGAAAVITQLAGGRVNSVVDNFTASTTTRRLYCCDGINQEWEFDGTVVVPIVTGMGSVRAKHVAVHKNHLFYLFNGSLQHSGIGTPYIWSPVFGAAELGTGDIGTDLLSVSGSESNATLMVFCKDSMFVLYGNSAADWDFKKISTEAGAQAYSAQEMLGSIAFDREGFTKYKGTDTFGNFVYESASRTIDPLVRNATVKCSVLVKNKARYRCFFADGLFVTGVPYGKGIAWMPCNYNRIINVAAGGEIAGQYRVFYGDSEGWVLEADVGRSFDGEEVEAYLRMASQNQGSTMTNKQYRNMEIVTASESAFELAGGAEFSDADPNVADTTEDAIAIFQRQYGAGLFYDFNSWDRSYWDVNSANKLWFSISGLGTSVSAIFQSVATNQLPHTIKHGTTTHTVRRLHR